MKMHFVNHLGQSTQQPSLEKPQTQIFASFPDLPILQPVTHQAQLEETFLVTAHARCHQFVPYLQRDTLGTALQGWVPSLHCHIPGRSPLLWHSQQRFEMHRMEARLSFMEMLWKALQKFLLE